ncbi:unnamed protein product [Cochlearia groenlandica]
MTVFLYTFILISSFRRQLRNHSQRSKIETVMEKKEMNSNARESCENGDEAEEDQESYVESYDLNTDFRNSDNLYEDEEEEEKDCYDFGLY